MNVTAQQIVKLLAQKHTGDVFVPECKDGPTVYGSHRRLDAWAMKRSWAKPMVCGYEIKVSRSDFLQDEKWQDYLGLCTHFSFVSPTGVIRLDETPKDAGLLWVSKTGGRLFTKKKAPRREICVPSDLYRYILMCRARIHDEHREPQDQAEYWRDWLALKAEKRDLGYRVSLAIREHVTAVEIENMRLRKENANAREVRAILERMGIDASHVPSAYTIEHRLSELQRLIPKDMRYWLARLKESLNKFEDQLAQHELTASDHTAEPVEADSAA